MSTSEKTVRIKKLPIRLGQFLKLADLVQDGLEAKLRIQNGDVMVNGIIETRRGRQLNHHDKISLDGETWIVDIDL